MASGTHCPIYHKFMFTVAVDGAAAPKGSMTYDSTQGNFLQVSESLGLRVSESPSLRGPPQTPWGPPQTPQGPPQIPWGPPQTTQGPPQTPRF